jgi:hypothetical protein
MLLWLLDVSCKFQGVGHGRFASSTLNQILDLSLELDCVFECHVGCAVCAHFIGHYLLSVQKMMSCQFLC